MAVELLVLTASRPGNIRQMRWEDIDPETATWTRPAEQMKSRRPHRVPLCRRAVDLLAQLRSRTAGSETGLVFPGRGGRLLSENTLNKAVQTLGVNATSHGFRTSFKEWSLSAGWPDHLSEAQLAHADPNRARAAYAREDLLEERRPMMQAWSDFVSTGVPARASALE
jgi:integrase